MELNIDPEAINKMVSDAILKSALGAAIEAAVKRSVQNLDRTYDNPLDKVVEKIISEEAYKTVVNLHGDRIKELVTAKLTEEFLGQVVNSAWEHFQQKVYR